LDEGAEIRLLVLGHSGDATDYGPPFGTGIGWLEHAVADLTGRRVQTRWEAVYPTPGLGRYAARLLDGFEPDVVLLHAGGLAVSFATINAYLESLFARRLERPIRSLVPRMLRWLDALGSEGEGEEGMHLRRSVYYAARNALLRLGLARTPMSVEDAATAYEAAIALVASREGVVFAVRGPGRHTVAHYPRRLEREARARLAALDERLERMCGVRRLPFLSPLRQVDGDAAPVFLHDSQYLAALVKTEAELLHPLLGEPPGPHRRSI